jgi:hypothetical protein
VGFRDYISGITGGTIRGPNFYPLPSDKQNMQKKKKISFIILDGPDGLYPT